jgi:sulfoxide reductase catalytic subunit YedY
MRVTPPEVFFDRRRFLQALGVGLAAIAGGCTESARSSEGMLSPPFDRSDVFPAPRNFRFELPSSLPRQGLTPREKAASYGNFFEFLPGRGGPVWKQTSGFEPAPWKLEVSGECEKPRSFDLDDLFAFEHEERVYHFRCVERWAMNVPWTGFPLRKLLGGVKPLASARFVSFISASRPEEMPGVRGAPYFQWPYREALRMDEAMCDLTLVATGAYGRPLLKQHGAPVRIVVPWKYGFKSPKSVVRIELTREQPRTFWQIQPHEYGFLANVNPNIPHPRWPQENSYWLDTGESFPTPLFNGYLNQVAALYPDEPTSKARACRPGEIAR